MAHKRRRYNPIVTPAQAGGYAVFDAAPPRRAVASGSSLNIFGLQFAIATGGSIVAPDRWYIHGTWLGTVGGTDGLHLDLDADVLILSIFRMRCVISVALEDDGAGNLVPATAQPPQSATSYLRLFKEGDDPGTRPMVLNYGYFAVQSDEKATDWLSSSDGEILLTATAASVWDSAQLPIALKSGTGAWTLDLSSARCLVSAHDDALRLSVSTIDADSSARTDLASLSSASLDFDLSSVSSYFTCRFNLLAEDDWLPLGVERLATVADTMDDGVAVTYGATAFALEATWTASSPIATLEAIDLLPAAGAAFFNIDAFSVIQTDGTPMRFGVPGRLPVWVRPPRSDRPGTLLLGFDRASAGLLQLASTDYLGWDEALVFEAATTATLDGLSEPWTPVLPGLSINISRTLSLPYLIMQGEPVSVRVARTEGRWRHAGQENAPASDVANWLFSGQRLCLPICPKLLTKSAARRTTQKFNDSIKPKPGDLAAGSWDIRHDTRFHDLPDLGPSPLALAALGGLPDLDDFGEKNTVSQYKSIRQFGALEVSKIVAPDDERKLDVLSRKDATGINFAFDVSLESNGKLRLASGTITFVAGAGMDDWPGFVGVYDSSLMVAEVLQATVSNTVLDQMKVHCSELFDVDLFPRGWVGAILFGIEGRTATGSEFELALGSSFAIGFVAITEDVSGQTSIYAAQANIEEDDPPAQSGPALEAALDVKQFELLIVKNQLVRMLSTIRMTVWSMLGLAARNGAVEIELRASLDGNQLEIRAYLDSPEILVDGGQAPIRSITISSAAGRPFDESGYGLALSAEILMDPLSFGSTFAWFGTSQSEQWIALSNIVLLPKPDPTSGFLYLEPTYGSIAFPTTSEHFHLTDILGASIRLTAIGISWGNDIVGRRDALEPLFSHNPPNQQILWFEAELDAGALSSFALSPGERLILKFMVQFPLTAGVTDPNSYWVGVSAAAIRNLTIGLYRIATLRAVRLELRRTTLGVEEVPYFDLINASIEVAGRVLVSGVTARIFLGRNGVGGFLICWEPTAGSGVPQWLLAGHNLRLDQSALSVIMNPDPAPGSNASLQALFKSDKADAILPRGTTSGRQDVSNWLLATAFDLSEVFSIKVLLSDSGYAGLTLAGNDLLKLIGLDGLSVLYVRGATPSDDRFELSVALPKASIGPFGFFGGVLQVTVTPAGDFLFDLGFPWMRRSGLREWDRTVGAMVSGLQASGGFYVERRTGQLIDETRVEVRAGYAIQWGIGVTGNFGPASASVQAGYFLVAEGTLTFTRGLDIDELHLLGAGGVLIEGKASVNLWIVSASIIILASAEVSVAIDWLGGSLIPPPAMPGALVARSTVNDISISLRLIVGVRIQAKVTIDAWFVSKTFKVNVETAVDMSTTIRVHG
ncbi:hypothetical protein LMIY3S_03656 [Labrys miyagiensis]